ncbi:MAG: type IV pilus secretin PilQ [Pyrinomonadaceae bacterium]|nr:type IV pilus secretin PilQ [Pyrinomonadaceae bacterium]
MNSLKILSVRAQRALIALSIISLLALTAAAQKIEPQNQGKMYGDPGFRGEVINLNVVNADIRDILNYITEQYGINFVIDNSVKQVPVTVNVSDVPWNVALDSIIQAQDLAIQVNGPILRVTDSKKLSQEQEIRRKNVEGQLDTSPLYTEFIRLNYARALGTLQGEQGSGNQTTAGVSVGGSGGGGQQGGQQGGQGGAGQQGADQGILGIVKRRVSRRGSVEVDGRSNTLIVTDVRENIDAIRQLVMLLDQPEPQVEIEARIVIASRNFSRDLGIQLAGMVLGRNGALGSGSTLPGTTNTTGLQPQGIPTGLGVQPNNSLISSIPNTVIGLTTGIFGTAQISALITAGEQKGQAKTIATPRVTTLNNRPAEIKSGSQIPITTIQPGSAVDGALIATTEYVSVPLRLAVTPQITDVGTIILNVTAENSTASTTVGGAPPPINTSSMQTQVMVPDGGTTVVGGVLFDDERESQDRTPGLSKIPIIGNLFKRKGVSRVTNELLFFITPRIYRPDYNGNPIGGKVSDGTRTTTIIQPVPLGNPPSNSSPVVTSPVVPTTGPVVVAPALEPAVKP